MKSLVLVVSGFTVGTILQATQVVTHTTILFILLLGGVLLVLRVLLKNPSALLPSVALLALAVGAGYTAFYQHLTEPAGALPFGDEVVVEGVVVKAEDRETTQHIVVASESFDSNVLVISGRFPEFSYGDVVSVSGALEEPEAFETDTGRIFDYPNYLAKDGIYATMLFSEITEVGSGEGNVAIRTLTHVRDAYVVSLAQVLPEPHAGLAAGITAGVRRALGDDVLDMFRIVGVIHIIVLSGYNVTIVGDVVTRLLRRIASHKIALGMAALGITLFALLVGFGATVVRASLMALLVVLARATGRTYDALRALFIAGIVMLLFNPLIAAFDPSFQLSFLATLGLILFSPYLETLFRRFPEWGGIRFIIVATIATQLFVLPLLLATIGEISLIAPFANIFVLIAVPLAMLFSFFAGIVGILHPYLALPFTAIGYVLLGYILTVSELFSRIPFASVTLPAFSLWWAFGLYGIYAFLLYALWRKDKRLKANEAAG